MSRDTEKLTTRYNRIAKQIQQKGAQQRLLAEECRIARQLGPRLEDQLAALKQSGCSKDPQVGTMIADIVRGHEDDLATMQKVPRPGRVPVRWPAGRASAPAISRVV